MKHMSQRHGSDGHNRRGMAPLEMVLIYPIFLAVLCCAMWVAGMMIRKAEVTVQARYNGDTLRYSQSTNSASSTTPFEFSEGSEGRVSGSATVDFKFSGIMPTGHPSASHTLLFNSWDHTQLPLDKLPETRLAMTLAARGAPENLKSRMQNAGSLMSDLGSVLSDFGSAFQPGNGLGGLQNAVSSVNLLQGFNGGTSSSAQNLATSMIAEQFPGAEVFIDLWKEFDSSRSDNESRANSRKQEGEQAAEKLKAASKSLEAAFSEVDQQLQKLKAAMANGQLSKEDKEKELLAVENSISMSLDRIQAIISSDADGALETYLKAAMKDIYLSKVRTIAEDLNLPESIVQEMERQFQEIADQGLERWKSGTQVSINNLRKAIGDADQESIDRETRVLGSHIDNMKRIVEKAAAMASSAGG